MQSLRTILRVVVYSNHFTLDNKYLLRCLVSGQGNQSRSCSSIQSGHDNPIFIRAKNCVHKTAIVDQFGKHSYGDLLQRSETLAEKFLVVAETSGDLKGHRICFLCSNDVSYVISQWATWINQGVAVPLCKTHPVSELEYFVEDSQCSLIVSTDEFADKCLPISNKLKIPHLVIDKSDYLKSSKGVGVEKQVRHDEKDCDEHVNMNAMLIYTSGTTGRPKGVVLTHGNLQAQISGMVSSWGWTENDIILHVLPLHHVHGIVNVLMTSLYCGATCVMLPKFDVRKVWAMLLNPIPELYPSRVNLFMAVPTIYAKLIEEIDDILDSELTRKQLKSKCLENIRLMVSGSAALPQTVMEKWHSITGHWLLERYGMSEAGMALTNPLKGPRVPGSVGNPFPKVEVRIVKSTEGNNDGSNIIAVGNNQSTTVTPDMKAEEGELQVKGPNVFKQYWNRNEATNEAFTPDGWFKTGDTAIFTKGTYKILGRTSVDIIKSGGYKISALDIERHLLVHPKILDCAVIGLPDDTWGQKVAAVIIPRQGEEILLSELRGWAVDRMPSYHIPTVIKCLDSMPRNAMGKVNKKQLAKDIF